MRTRTLLLSLFFAGTLSAQDAPSTTAPAFAAGVIPVTPPAPAAAPDAVTVVAGTPVAVVTKSKDTLSVDFPDEEIRTILRNVADLFELNLVIPDTLQGRTSLKLRDVTWRQIFQVALSPIGYTFVEDGNIIKIISQDSLAQEPFITNSVVLDNVAAASIEPLVKSNLTPAQAATATTPAISGGSIVLNSLANELIVTDKSAVVRRIIETVKRLDSEPRQVVIETKFIELTKNQGKDLAVGLAGKQIMGGGTTLSNGALNTLGQILPTGPIATGSPTAGSVGSLNAVLNANDFSLLLRAFDSLSGTRIVSNPTIVAVNGSTSNIEIGTDFQLVTATQTAPTGGGTPTVTYSEGKTVFEGVKVQVTPQITSSKLVSLAIKTEKSNATPFTVGAGATAQTFYDINKREGTLNMILKDGQTAAIGGLMDTKDSKTDVKVPLLGDIPVLGFLFKSKVSKKVDTNLCIFITASILEPSKTTYHNLATKAQLDELSVTDRDIEGVNYKISDDEARLYEKAKSVRQQKQDEAIKNKLATQAVSPGK